MSHLFQFPISPQLIGAARRNLKIFRVLPWGVGLVTLVIFYGLVLFGETDVAPAKIAGIALISSATLVLVSFVTVQISARDLRRAVSLIGDEPQVLTLSTNQISIPVLLLMNPSLWRVLDAEKTHLVIPWQDVISISAEPGMGRTRPHFKLLVRGASAVFGTTLLNTGPNFGPPAILFKRGDIAEDQQQIFMRECNAQIFKVQA